MATQAIIRSNAASALLNGLYDQGLEDMSYVTQRSFPNVAANEFVQVQPLQSLGGTLYGQTQRFDIPKTSLLGKLVQRLDFTFTNAGATIADTSELWDRLVGLDIVEQCELRTRSYSISTINGSAQRARSSSSYNQSKTLGIHRRSMLLNQTTLKSASATLTTTEAATVTVFLMPEFWFQESVEQYLDTAYIEPLQYVVRYNDADLTGLNGYVLSNVSSSLWLGFNTPEFSIYNSLQAKNFGGADNYQVLMYDTLSDVQACSNATTNTINIRINNPTFMVYVSVVDNQGDRASGVAGQTFQPIQTHNFIVNTRRYQDTVPYLITNFEMECQGGSRCSVDSSFDVSFKDDGPLAIHFGMVPNMSWTANTGAITFSNVDSPQVTVVTPTLGTPSEFNLICDYFFYCLGIIGKNSQFVKSSST